MLTDKLTGNRTLGKQRRRREDNIGMDSKGVDVNTRK
jgi:hypothetical protein